MKVEIQNILDRKMSKRAAAERYQVLRKSLQDCVKAVKQGQQIIRPTLGTFQRTLIPEYERQWFHHVTDLHNSLKPLTRSQFLQFAYDLEEKSNIDLSLVRKRWLEKNSFGVSRREIQISR